MASVNKCLLIGHLGKEVELRYTGSGKAVASFSMATQESWKGKDGGKEEKTEWHKIVAWGRLGEICGQYLMKGSQVYIEGRLQTREWNDKEGNKRYTTEIVAQTMQMLGGGGKKGEGGGGGSKESAQGGDGWAPGGPADDEQIPF